MHLRFVEPVVCLNQRDARVRPEYERFMQHRGEYSGRIFPTGTIPKNTEYLHTHFSIVRAQIHLMPMLQDTIINARRQAPQLFAKLGLPVGDVRSVCMNTEPPTDVPLSHLLLAPHRDFLIVPRSRRGRRLLDLTVGERAELTPFSPTEVTGAARLRW